MTLSQLFEQRLSERLDDISVRIQQAAHNVKRLKSKKFKQEIQQLDKECREIRLAIQCVENIKKFL